MSSVPRQYVTLQIKALEILTVPRLALREILFLANGVETTKVLDLVVGRIKIRFWRRAN